MSTKTSTSVSGHGPEDDLLTPEDVARILRRPLGTLRQWRHHGRGPRSFRLEGSVMYRRRDVDAYIAEQERATATGGPPAA